MVLRVMNPKHMSFLPTEASAVKTTKPFLFAVWMYSIYVYRLTTRWHTGCDNLRWHGAMLVESHNGT